MDKNIFNLILQEIEQLKFKDAIIKLNKSHDESNINYLYLRSYLFFKQENYYQSLDILLLCFKKKLEFCLKDKNYKSLLIKILNKIERVDIVKKLQTQENEILENLLKWQGYKIS